MHSGLGPTASSSNGIGPTVASSAKVNAAGQTEALESFAREPGPTGAIPLPSPASQAVATQDAGNGRMIGGSLPTQKGTGADGNVVLNLSSVPLQQAAKTVLGDMIGVNYVVDPRVEDRIGGEQLAIAEHGG